MPTHHLSEATTTYSITIGADHI